METIKPHLQATYAELRRRRDEKYERERRHSPQRGGTHFQTYFQTGEDALVLKKPHSAKVFDSVHIARNRLGGLVPKMRILDDEYLIQDSTIGLHVVLRHEFGAGNAEIVDALIDHFFRVTRDAIRRGAVNWDPKIENYGLGKEGDVLLVDIGGLVEADNFLEMAAYDADDSDHFFFMSKLAECLRDIPAPHLERTREKTREYGFDNASVVIATVGKEANTQPAVEASFPDIEGRLEEIRALCRSIFSVRGSTPVARVPSKPGPSMEHPSRALTDLFAIPETYVLTESTARYYGSLTPSLDVMKRMRAIHYEVTFDAPPPTAHPLPYENDVNVHLFKPKFFADAPDASEVRCIVPCPEVLAHSLRSLAAFSHSLGRRDIAVTIAENHRPYRELCDGWKISDHVILCWRESFLKFLRVHWLLEHGVNPAYVQELVCELENRLKEPDAEAMTRLAEGIRRDHGLRLDDFESTFDIRHQLTPNPCVASSVLKYKDKDITLIQLSWGRALSREIAKAVVAMNPAVAKIGSVGGIGYAKDDHLSLDDIFLPRGLVVADDRGSFQTRDFPNHIFGAPDNTHFRGKNVSEGYMKTVVPTIGVLSNTAAFKDKIDLITGFDMELEGFREVLDRHPHIRHASAHYIMDLPFRGLSLGDTYYHRPYLERFFRTFNRGKYHCFERMLSFMTQD